MYWWLMMRVRALLTKKILVMLLIGGVLTSGLAAYGTLGKRDKIQYQTAKAERGMIVSTVSASGQVLDLDVVEVTTQATGVVKELYVKEGDTVRAGDRLLTLELDKDGIMAKEKAWAAYLSAKADLDAAEQNALSAQGSVKAAEIELENAKQAKLALEKELKLAEASLVAAQHEWNEVQSGSGASEAQRKQKELALQAAQDALTLAQQRYKSADKTIEQAELKLSLAQKNAEQAALSASLEVKAAEIELENAKQAKLALQRDVELAKAALAAAEAQWEAVCEDAYASEAERRQKWLELQAAENALDLAQQKYENADEAIEKAELNLSLAQKKAEQDAQAEVKAAEIELENAKQAKLALEKELKLAEASLIAAQREWEEVQSGSGTSEANRKQKELALQAAREALTLAQRKYETADASIAKAALELSLAKQRAGSGSNAVAKAAASVTVAWAAYEATLPTVTAPVSGKIIGLNVVAGAAVKSNSSGTSSSAASTSPGYRVASILLGDLRLARFNVSEVDIPKVKIGQKATITVDALPGKTFTGKVVGIDRTGTVESGVTSYPVTVQFDTPSGAVLPQMAANASIITETKDNALLIPASAVKTVQGETVVTVLRRGQAEQRPVVLGLSADTQVEVVSGLSEGEEVVVGALSGGQQGTGSPFSGRTSGTMRPGSFGGTPFPAGRNLR
jgi:multidrug efflux pump subunit AcrA (membrane-fusion protein)